MQPHDLRREIRLHVEVGEIHGPVVDPHLADPDRHAFGRQRRRGGRGGRATRCLAGLCGLRLGPLDLLVPATLVGRSHFRLGRRLRTTRFERRRRAFRVQHRGNVDDAFRADDDAREWLADRDRVDADGVGPHRNAQLAERDLPEVHEVLAERVVHRLEAVDRDLAVETHVRAGRVRRIEPDLAFQAELAGLDRQVCERQDVRLQDRHAGLRQRHVELRRERLGRHGALGLERRVAVDHGVDRNRQWLREVEARVADADVERSDGELLGRLLHPVLEVDGRIRDVDAGDTDLPRLAGTRAL